MTPRATFICGGALVPASRFRVHQVEAGLRACGWSTRLIEGYGPLDQRLGGTALQRPYRAACRLRRAWRTARLDSDGPVMVQRLAWPWSAMPEVRLAANCDGLVFDFDDAVFLGAGGRPSRSRRRALDAVFAASRYIVAGNSWLAQAVEAPVPVTVLPTCIDTSRYLPRPDRSPGGRPVIGWIGTSGNFPYLHRLVEPMRRLRAWGCDFDLRICSDVEPAGLCKALGASFERWSAEGELGFLQSLDIGLMPLENNDWCRGKCSFKLIQYMSVGAAVVASSVGMNRDVVTDGEVGFLVGDGWAEALATLVADRRMLERMGQAARARAVACFDVARAVGQYRDSLGALQ